MLKLHILASGSRGNATIVENDQTGHGILIDCGICKRDFLARCSEAHFNPAKIDAVLITHDHGDHTKGLGVVIRGLAKLNRQPTVYAADETVRASKAVQDAVASCGTRGFRAEECLSAAGMSIFPFVTSHDAAVSFGFRIEADDDAAGFMTDTGIVTPQAHAHLENVRLLALESNHDPKMLHEGPYPYVVKQRIASDRGASFKRTGRRGACIPSERTPPSSGSHAYLRKQQRIRPGTCRLPHGRGERRPQRPRAMRVPRTAYDNLVTY